MFTSRFFPSNQQFYSIYRKMSSWVAVCQGTSTNDMETNFSMFKDFINTAVEKKAAMVFLPECFDFLASSPQETIALSDSIDTSAIIKRYQMLAKDKSVWLSLGGFHEKIKGNGEKIYMSHIIIDENGEIQNVYRKTHLFDFVSNPGSPALKESDYVCAGSELPCPVQTPVGNVAPLICYDIRFPEISSHCAQSGANILTYPSAFTIPTGSAHWHVLLRARAIENQCYVIAAAQCGKHNEKRSTFGHALVVDPWGTVICDCGENPGIGFAEIKLEYVNAVRNRLPVLKHKRLDLYQKAKMS